MLNKFKFKIKVKNEVLALGILLIITIIFTTYYNFTKKRTYENYKNIINNIYFKKTINHFLNKLEPRFRKITHEIKGGETFNNILEQYSIDKNEISIIKSKLSKKIDLNKLKTKQKIYLTIDQANQTVKKLVFQISNKERIILTQDVEKNTFNQEIVLTKLEKKVVYSENIILQSLYKSAINKRIPANIIVEFARIYGFQIDFQRDIKINLRFPN